MVIVVLAVTGRWQLALLADSRALSSVEVLPASVRVVSVESEVVSTGIHYSAVVKELQKAELSFRVAGTVESLHQIQGPGGRLRNVHEGDRVPRGTALARLDTGDFGRDHGVATERLASAEARLAQAEADQELAQVEFRRTDQLVRRGSATIAELDSARAKLRNTTAAALAARRDAGSAKISLEQAKANLSYCTLAMPFAEGTIAARYVESNERVAANQRAFLILDLSSMLIAFGVPDTLVGRLALGQVVEITSDAVSGERFEGVIHKIGSTADLQTRTYAIEVRIDRPRGLRPGMVATAHFRHDSRAYLLPLTSVVPRASTHDYAVYRIVDEEGRTVARQVPVAFDDVLDNRIAVQVGASGGLRPGDRVVATGTHRLYDGQAVKVVD